MARMQLQITINLSIPRLTNRGRSIKMYYLKKQSRHHGSVMIVLFTYLIHLPKLHNVEHRE